ncbi:hypothetical protein QW060_16640 [Myroides ceti]|uniref:Uncharacterized protein n=1 Tax=Paenimyroides ceti TaxID=395087 RepID=A0ABT8CYT6_9FLAO|nr:hypothetical protein [Paenimyroides ceti]MDN3708732.1 hypothetical protein [Paenimyroides ceti]
MKSILFVLFIALSGLSVKAQSKLAVVQKEKAAPVYITRTIDSEIITELAPGTFVYTENSTQNLVNIQFFSTKNGELTEGFVEKNLLFVIENKKANEKKIFYKNFLETFITNANKNKIDIKTLDYNYNLLSSYITEQICETKDSELLVKFVESLASISTYLDEKQEFTLAELLICMQNSFIDSLNAIPNINEKRALTNHLITGLKDYYAIDDVEDPTHKEFQKNYLLIKKITF